MAYAILRKLLDFPRYLPCIQEVYKLLNCFLPSCLSVFLLQRCLVTGWNVFASLPSDSTINSSLHFSQGLQANSSNCRSANWLEEFCKNSLLNRREKICKVMTVYQRLMGISGPDSHQRESRIDWEQRDLKIPAPFLGSPSLAPPIFSSLNIKESWILDSLRCIVSSWYHSNK